MPVEIPSMSIMLHRSWWVLLLRGAAAIIFGVLTWMQPAASAAALVLVLTSPAGRPIQTTRDLPGFWAGGYAEVRKEMRGRYPRHPWPDDPAAAIATTRTKNADARARGSR